MGPNAFNRSTQNNIMRGNTDHGVKSWGQAAGACPTSEFEMDQLDAEGNCHLQLPKTPIVYGGNLMGSSMQLCATPEKWVETARRRKCRDRTVERVPGGTRI